MSLKIIKKCVLQFYCELSSTLVSGYQTTIAFFNRVAAIKVAIDILLRSADSFREVCIHTDSRSAIAAMSSLTGRSKLVKEGMISLAIASNFFHNRFV